MAGAAQKILFEIALDRHGYVTTADARRAGVDPKRLVDLEASGQAERVSRGIYRLEYVPHDELDQFMFASIWPQEKGVISHESAASIHRLCDVNPSRIDVTIPRSLRVNAEPPRILRLHRSDLDPQSVTRIDDVPVVTPERAIRDMIGFGTRRDLVRQAIETARREALISSIQKDQLTVQFVQAANG